MPAWRGASSRAARGGWSRNSRARAADRQACGMHWHGSGQKNRGTGPPLPVGQRGSPREQQDTDPDLEKELQHTVPRVKTKLSWRLGEWMLGEHIFQCNSYYYLNTAEHRQATSE